VPKLGAKHQLICPKRSELDLTSGLIDLDLYVRENKIEFVIHLAHPRLYHLPSAMSEAILMMRNVLEVSRLHDLPLLYLSSLAVFSGYHGVLNNLSEVKPLPESAYGQTKFLCEQLIRVYMQLYDLEVILLRPSYVYGPGMDSTRVLYKFIRKALAQEQITVHRYTNGFQVFDFLYIDDLVDAILLCLEIMPRDPINIGTGVGTSTFELAQIIKRLTRSNSEVRIVNVDGETSRLVVDPSEAITLLGWKQRTALDNGLESLASTTLK